MRHSKDTLGIIASTSPAFLLAAVAALGTSAIGWSTLAGQVMTVSVTLLVFVLALRGAGAARRTRGDRVEVTTSVDLPPFERMFDELPGSVWRSDVVGARTYVNAKWCTWTGLDEDAARGGGWTEAVHPEDRARVESVYRLAITTHGFFDLEYRLQHTDGGCRTIREEVRPLHDEAERLLGFVGFGLPVQGRRDDTESAEEVERAHRLNATINEQATKLADRFDQLDAARQRAEHDDQLKGEYLAALADEIREPIDTARHIVDLLKRAELAEGTDEHIERLGTAADELQLIHVRTEKLGVVADPDKLENEEFNLRRIIDQVLKDRESAALEKELNITTAIASTVPAHVMGDPLRMRRILLDLTDAAIRLAPRGRITLRVSQELISKTSTLVRLAFVVLDSDVDEDLVERAYFPIEAISREQGGLGLAACRRLAKLMKGNVGIERDGKGGLAVWVTIVVEEVNPNWEGRRSSSRLSQEAVRCNLGEVLDLSMGGMRVRCPRSPEGRVEVELFDDEETISLDAEVAWTRRIGFGKHQAGLQFVDVSADATAQLGRLAARNRLRRIMDAA